MSQGAPPPPESFHYSLEEQIGQAEKHKINYRPRHIRAFKGAFTGPDIARLAEVTSKGIGPYLALLIEQGFVVQSGQGGMTNKEKYYIATALCRETLTPPVKPPPVKAKPAPEAARWAILELCRLAMGDLNKNDEDVREQLAILNNIYGGDHDSGKN